MSEFRVANSELPCRINFRHTSWQTQGKEEWLALFHSFNTQALILSLAIHMKECRWKRTRASKATERETLTQTLLSMRLAINERNAFRINYRQQRQGESPLCRGKWVNLNLTSQAFSAIWRSPEVKWGKAILKWPNSKDLHFHLA